MRYSKSREKGEEAVEASLSHSRRIRMKGKGMYRLVRPNHAPWVMVVIHRSCRVEIFFVAVATSAIAFKFPEGLANT
jgi:hypothetical protein